MKNDEQVFFNDMRSDHGLRERTENTEKSPIIKDLSDYTEKSEKVAILKALNQNRWNKGKTAAILNISRKTLHRKMQRLGLL